MKKVAFDTLGCKLNYSETSAIRKDFADRGFEVSRPGSHADIYVINTCSVTQNANSDCRKSVRRALKTNPNAFVAVVGCYAQLEPDEIAAIDGVDAVLGARDKFKLPDLFDDFHKVDKTLIYHSDINELADFHHAWSGGDRTRSFLKIQDGCDYNCSFCTIPLARGKSRSPAQETLLANARQLVREGFLEIVLTGVNAGDFGKGRQENYLTLLRALDRLPGLERIRTSSIEPNLLTSEIIAFCSRSAAVQPHFHMPLQSGSDEILKMMRRRYLTPLYRERVEEIRRQIPDACIGVDVITGHPGETERHFQETIDFIEQLDISYLHVFTYSERPNTHALSLKPVVPVAERKRRTAILRRLSAKKRFEFDTRHIGQIRPVLFESRQQDNFIQGWTDNYIRVRVPFHPRLENRICPVEIGKRARDGVMMGKPDRALLDELSVIEELTADA